jgi:hypothetical protein
MGGGSRKNTKNFRDGKVDHIEQYSKSTGEK